MEARRLANAAEVNGVDTESLQPSQLSDHEWDILLQIEQRLSEVSRTAPNDRTASRDCSDSGQPAQFKPTYLAGVETRYQRVLLLDGGRGTGKTSLLLTLINRWHGAAGALDTPAWLTPEEESELAERRRELLPTSQASGAPKNIRVIRNLDFDPLPPEMPLIAGIVQAWRPLVEHYDRKTFRSDELCDDIESRRLMDSWHSVFRVAAGWSAVVGGKGLVEQVLDQEEQVRDWQDLRGKWLWFINEVIRIGRCLKSDRLDDPPVFVIVIDDVDLQVERIRELLPALRMLAHENVFFLIAADREHMVDMLRFDFLGQQRNLAAASHNGVSKLKGSEGWAAVLANAAFEKVFPTRNRWHLDKLSLSAFLEFPKRSGDVSGVTNPSTHPETSDFQQLLKPVVARGALATKNVGSADTMISGLAKAAEAVSLDLPALSYRSAQQLWQAIMPGEKATASQAADVLAGLLSSNSDERAVVRRDKDRTIEVPAIGELTAFYRPGFVDLGEYDIVVSAQPDFWFISTDDDIVSMRESRGRGFNFTAGLIAKTLQEAQFAIDATALRWETYLSLAWTTWRDIPATFAWTWHKHPRPDELLRHTDTWAGYVTTIYERTKLRDRHAYAWIYFERERCLNPSRAKAPTEIGPDEELPWGDLLRFDAPAAVSEERDLEIWKTVTLPLLARPEIGLPPDVQRHLLQYVPNKISVKRKLRIQRRRLMTDAMFVAELQNRKVKNNLPAEEVVKQKIQYIDQRYEDLNDELSPWSMKVGNDKPHRKIRKAGL
jgi:hypothetical protein